MGAWVMEEGFRGYEEEKGPGMAVCDVPLFKIKPHIILNKLLCPNKPYLEGWQCSGAASRFVQGDPT